MSATAVEIPFTGSSQHSRWRRLKPLRVACWLVALACGAGQGWCSRFHMDHDGISYLDVANFYLKHDWQRAINTYWSPVYSWILGLFLRLLKPSTYWEFPVVHLTNLLTYIVMLAAFDFLLATFLADRRRRGFLNRNGDRAVIPEWLWGVVAYSLFLSCSNSMIGVQTVSPDQLVAAAVFAATALLLKIRSGLMTERCFAFLGLVLGAAYLSKGVMFLVALAFFATAAPAARRSGLAWRAVLSQTLLSFAIFLAISAPFCIALSIKTHHLTFGETGKWNYVFYANTTYTAFSRNPQLNHPVKKTFDEIPAYEFGNQPGTFPLWYDPAYWQEGIKPHFEIRRQLVDLVTTLTIYTIILLNPLYQGIITAFILVLFALVDRPHDFFAGLRGCWPLLVPGTATLLLYSAVHVEARLVAPFLVLLWISAFAAIQVPAMLSRILTIAVILLAALLAIVDANQIAIQFREAPLDRENVLAAQDLQSLSLQKGDNIALLWIEDEAMHAGAGSYVAELAKLHIKAEMVGPERFWSASPETRASALKALAATGSRILLEFGKPMTTDEGWQNLPGTNWYFCWLH